MENSSLFLSVNRTLTWICCMFCIFFQGGKAEWKTISEMVGNRVTLQCNNESISTLTQLTWKMNGVKLFTFTSLGELYINSQEVTNLALNMSKLESQLYELIIEKAQTNHTANYTCETATLNGIWDQKWRLIIKESTKHWDILMEAVVPSVCLLILLISLAILIRFCKRRARNRHQSPPAEVQQRTEDIYENCLEMERRNQRKGHHYQPLAIQHCM